jgi:hypothetical protein
MTVTPRRATHSAAALLAVAAVLLPACDGSPSEPRVEVRFETLAKATVPGHFGPPGLREVVRDQARWESVWREVWGSSVPAQPAVDFTREMVVVASASAPCLGDVVVDSVVPVPGGVLVSLGDSGPPHLCLCIQAEYTFHAVRAPRIDGPADFEVRQIPSRCG